MFVGFVEHAVFFFTTKSIYKFQKFPIIVKNKKSKKKILYSDVVVL